MQAKEGETVVGNIRVQSLSPHLIRIEQKGPAGFEDRQTFTVVERTWAGEKIRVEKRGAETVLKTANWEISLPQNANMLTGISIRYLDGATIQLEGMPETTYLPGPVDKPGLWIMPDSPRLVPPQWGAIPPPENTASAPTSGWDTGNNAPDVYIFALDPGEYPRFRSEFLKLTGPVPMPPLYTFGLWDSRYHPYSEETALATIQTYRDKKIPLDVFVVDTDWRVGASHGYGVNDSLFPDMRGFIERAHQKNVKLMYNDHPEPQQKSALDPAEIGYRWEGLTSLLEMGIDVWWYDRNWHTGLLEPMPGLSKEVWGMRLYHDITQKFNPRRRPLIMSNVDGIDNGAWNSPSHPAAHRFPIWWTGDQVSRWEDLQRGVANGVNSGIARLMPYVNEDLGGHTGGDPDPEQYIRWVQFGAFSPVMRLHCTRGLVRYPWAFGEEAEAIASAYIRLRYRLLPTIYAAARQAYEDGTPLMRRGDLEWPDKPDANGDLQFFLGEDLLVAPVVLGKTRDVPFSGDLLKSEKGGRGLTGHYFNSQDLSGGPVLTREDTVVNFNWGNGGPGAPLGKDHFSVRWTGQIGPFGEDGVLDLKVVADDGVRLWIGDKLLVDAWIDQGATDYPVRLAVQAGQSYPIRIEYYENGGEARLQLMQTIEIEPTHQVWIPPGSWQDVWSGERLQGPKTLEIHPNLWQTPLYVRESGIILSVPQMQYTAEKPWETVMVDAFVPSGDGQKTRILYEDDGESTAYRSGAFAKTAVELGKKGNSVSVKIAPRQGDYAGAVSQRDWVLRLHLPVNARPENLTVNGKKVDMDNNPEVRLLTEAESNPQAMPFRGPGSKPAPQAGAILEVAVKQPDCSRGVKMAVELQ
ncbi:MAG: DUF5110 domain-containing protein [Calditrichaeota bacterium]|nr:DUF5110 domain-containing protein [Calditrichota bacterium]